jgi:transcriptional regulator with XRE-family HTH domain
MEARKLVGWNVRRLRVAKELTIEELADRAGADASFVARLERGQVNVGVDMLQRLAKPLGVKLADFAIEPAAGAKPPKPLRAGRRPEGRQASKSTSAPDSRSLKEREPGLFGQLRAKVRQGAFNMGKEERVEDPHTLDVITEETARVLMKPGKTLADVLVSRSLMTDVINALSVLFFSKRTPADRIAPHDDKDHVVRRRGKTSLR